jgi:lantibiotic transport system permease protein
MIPIIWALMSTEAIKLRHSLALWLAVAAPLLAILAELIGLFDRYSPPSGDAAAMWRALLQNGWAFWLSFFAPMLIAFQAASLANFEHAGRLWKQLFAFPVPRWSVYATKMLACGLLLGASFLILVPGYIGDVLIYSGTYGLHLASSIPFAEIFLVAGKAFLASWLVIVVQTWLATRFSGITASLGIGFAATIMGFVLLGILGRRGEDYASWYPWLLALLTHPGGPYDRHNTLLPLAVGCVGGLLFGGMACWDLARRREGD